MQTIFSATKVLKGCVKSSMQTEVLLSRHQTITRQQTESMLLSSRSIGLAELRRVDRDQMWLMLLQLSENIRNCNAYSHMTKCSVEQSFVTRCMRMSAIVESSPSGQLPMQTQGNFRSC